MTGSSKSKKPETETVVEQLSAAREQLTTLTQERDDARKELQDAKDTIADHEATIKDLTKDKNSLTLKLGQAEIDRDKKAEELKTEKDEADQLKKRLALDPDHIDISGRADGVTDTSETEGGNELAEYERLHKESRSKASKYYRANREAILEQRKDRKEAERK
jgi:chromosome segregation ATPase